MDAEKEEKKSENRYKSPKSKLIRFFEGSRNKWKRKTKDAKYQIKLLRKKLKYLEKNKQEDKKHSKNLEKQLQQMQGKEKRMQNEIDQLKKKL